MINRDKLISALHCRAQDLSIDLPACDGCDYHDQLESISNGGCNIKRLCKDALDLLKAEQPGDLEPMIRLFED